MQRFDDLPQEIILNEILSNLDPKFLTILRQINKQFSNIVDDTLFWKNKIEKHFPDDEKKPPFNKAIFKKIEAKHYKDFSEQEKELSRLIIEEDIESLQNFDLLPEMLEKKDSSGKCILFRAQKINYSPLTDWLNQAGFAAAKKIFANNNAKLDHKKVDSNDKTLLYWALLFQQNVETLLKLLKDDNFFEFYYKKFQFFHLAIALGRLDFIEAIFNDKAFKDNLGILLEKRNVFGQTPLIMAAQYGDVKIVNFLLDHKADYKAITDAGLNHTNYGKSAFYWAVVLGNLELVKLFTERFPELLEKRNVFGEAPLLWATLGGHISIIKYFHSKNSSLKLRTDDLENKIYNMTTFFAAIKSGKLETVKFFVNEFPNLLDEKNIFGKSPLHGAAAGHVSIVKFLLDQGVNPNVRVDIHRHEDQYKTPLYYAAENGHSEVVEILIKSGAIDWHQYGAKKMRVIDVASERGHLNVIVTLMNTKPDLRYIAEHNRLITLAQNYIIKDLPNLHKQKNKFEQTPLLFAARNGHDETVKYFLEKNADPNVKTNNSYSEIHEKSALRLAFDGDHSRTVGLLIKYGANTTTRDVDGVINFVHHSVKNGKFEMLQALIDNDPHPPSLLEQKDRYGQTALIWAAALGEMDMVAYLLSKGADIHVSSYFPEQSSHKDNGKTPLLWAFENKYWNVVVALFKASHGHIDPLKNITSLQLKTELINFAAANNDLELMEIILKDSSLVLSALFLIIKNNNLEMLKIILENKNNLINYKNENGQTPLLFALALGYSHRLIAAYLLDQGADPNLNDKLGRTPLLLALAFDLDDLAESLLNKGANPNARVNFCGYETTIFHITTVKGKKKIVDLILAKNAIPQTTNDVAADHLQNLPSFYSKSNTPNASSDRAVQAKIKLIDQLGKKEELKPNPPLTFFNQEKNATLPESKEAVSELVKRM